MTGRSPPMMSVTLFGRHGDPATEARLGQLAVTADDFRLAAIALRDGQWRLDGTTDIGRPAIVLEYSHPQCDLAPAKWSA